MAEAVSAETKGFMLGEATEMPREVNRVQGRTKKVNFTSEAKSGYKPGMEKQGGLVTIH